ncbi:MAG: pirin family protein [Chloroflexi bacterium]|uniref:Pirin family protein n=1 Tax=Candidatus Chlorohelix allophototropha TaxID=3003348 RepID=A0A8T7M7E2_9CHLR|nr:pirin family protein [Chloroflexota bacterium]WJW69827.1 pirin family protein [Chloroflexota bacterium L227-S17]
MITLRKADERGHMNYGWLDTRHTFSFSEYYDPQHMGFRQLRVINQDRVKPAMGFPTHPHRDMEIISYVLDGALEHKDSMGNGSVIRPGDVQRMSAGSGITHSEYNHSKDDLVHFLQIWLIPERKGITPGYEQKYFTESDKRGKLRLVASPNGQDDSVSINQDVSLYAALLESGEYLEYKTPDNRYTWVQVARGELMLNEHFLKEGDGVAASPGELLKLVGEEKAEILLFDLF